MPATTFFVLFLYLCVPQHFAWQYYNLIDDGYWLSSDVSALFVYRTCAFEITVTWHHFWSRCSIRLTAHCTQLRLGVVLYLSPWHSWLQLTE